MHEKIENNPLELFHPLIKQWFLEKVGTPTDIQAKAWPEIAGKKHVLVTAPTGSGKTLTAFLWAINNFLLNRNAMSSHRVLYISPLKALNNDIRRNLETPLEELRQFFEEANEPFPEIRTAVRSGDTEPKERRQIARNPPEIFITTPESLNILLASKSGRKVLMGISTVILDEIHAVAATKRGTFLITAIDRLVSLCGEFQRIALSATVKPLEKVAEFIGGYKILGADEFQKRRVSIIKSNIRKKYAINVKFPENAGDIKKTEAWWQALTAAFKNVIQQNRSTLFFANSRRMVEKITRFINEEGGEGRVYSHHGSLSKEIRSVVEKRFKDEELSAIISTSSLELGIDIGSVDEVVLIQAPFSIASAIQRIGRSGHGVGKVSRGTFYPIHSRDLIEDAVLAPNITTGCIESIEPMEAPLDVLAQILLSMTLLETMDIDELYTEIRSSSPYHNLSRKEFDLVLEMLAGRYADARIRELKPRILLDRIKNTAKTRDNASLLLFLSGGVIPDRGYFNMRDVNTKAKIGELDEEFVWERSLGDAFPLGNQVWRIQRITHNDVEVARVKKTNSLIPFWRAEEMNRSYFLSEKIGNFLEEANKNIAVTDGVYKKNVTDGVTKTAIKESTVSKNTGEGANPEFQKKLQTHHFMSEKAALELIAYLKLQKKETDASLPHRHHLLVEHFRDPVNTADSKQTVLHTMWGGPVNRPLAFALSAAWEEKYNYTLDVFVNNDCIMLNLPHAFGAQDILALLKPSKLRQLLRSKLESTGYFGARFRENASCALLLPRKGFQNRMPLWLNRLRSKKLMEAVSRYEDFPILLETWRGCMNHDFEIDRLLSLLGEIETGEITITETVTRKPSPFADGIIWRQTNEYMYYGDSPASKLRTNLSDSLLKEVMYSSQLRPRFSDELLEEFRQKLQRVAPGYSPASGEELLQWARERLYIPAAEWHELLEAIARDHELDTTELTASIEERLFRLKRSHSNHARQDELWAIIALENLPAVSRALGLVGNDVDIALQGLSLPDSSAEGDDERNGFVAFLIEWLRYYGPVSRDFPLAVLGVKEVQLSGVLEALREEGEIIIDEFRVFDGKSAVPVEEELCESENLEILLRMRRNRARPSLDPLDIEVLPLYLASYQGLTVPGDGPEDLQDAFEKLFGYTAKVGLWETDILPARLEPYYTSWLDSLMRENELLWFGSGNERSGFCFQPDLELFATGPVDSSQRSDGEAGKNKRNNAKHNNDKSDNGNSKGKDSGNAKFSGVPVELERIFSEARGKFSLSDLAKVSGFSTGDIGASLWDLAWRGLVSNDDYRAVRNGITGKFKPAQAPEMGRRSRGRYNLNRWQSSRPFSGNWFRMEAGEGEAEDALDRQDLIKDRIRQLFMRYGVVFRELLWNELPSLRWARVFPVLRLMELSGEIVSGQFFKGVYGLQFCTPAALGVLMRGLPEESVYWMNAADPASVCGIGIEGLKPLMPHRLVTSHLVFYGKQLVLVSRKNGKELTFMVEPGHPKIGEFMGFFKTLVGRDFNPLKYISVETVNDRPVLESDYREPLKEFGFKKDYRSMMLMKAY